MKPWEVIDMLAACVKGRYPCPSGVIAQLVLEVGFELKTPKDIVTGRESYNLGNIKGTGPAGSVTILTKEYYTVAQVEAARRAGVLVQIIGLDNRDNSKWIVQVRDVFRAYRNYGEAIDDHYALLKKPRYVNVGLWEAKTPLAYATALKTAGYATDTAYVEKIMAIVKRYQLTRFDVPEKQAEKETAVTIKYKDKTFGGRLLDSLTWAPARAICNVVGAAVGFTGNAVQVNGTLLSTRVIDNTGYVPIRELAKALQLGVAWDGKANTATLK